MALRKQNQNRTLNLILKPLSCFWRPDSLLEHRAGSTGSRGSEEPMIDAGVNSCLVNRLLFTTTGIWRTFALSLQNPWSDGFGEKHNLSKRKGIFLSCFMQLLSQPFFLLQKIRHRFTKLPSGQSWAIHFKAAPHFQG